MPQNGVFRDASRLKGSPLETPSPQKGIPFRIAEAPEWVSLAREACRRRPFSAIAPCALGSVSYSAPGGLTATSRLRVSRMCGCDLTPGSGRSGTSGGAEPFGNSLEPSRRPPNHCLGREENSAGSEGWSPSSLHGSMSKGRRRVKRFIPCRAWPTTAGSARPSAISLDRI